MRCNKKETREKRKEKEKKKKHVTISTRIKSQRIHFLDYTGLSVLQ